MDIQRTFHLHMISDATGETLITIAKAVRVQYAQVRAIEHLHPLVRSRRELERVVKDVEAAPGIVLYTLFNREFADELEQSCKRLNIPCVFALKPILQVFESYLGTPATPTAIYLAQRGFKTANVPLVPGVTLPPQLEMPTSAFVVGLVASPERIAQVRQNRVIEHAHNHLEDYVDREAIAAEIAQTRALCARRSRAAR